MAACPFLFLTWPKNLPTHPDAPDCLKKRCQFWVVDRGLEECLLATLSRSLRTIALLLSLTPPPPCQN